MSGHSQGVDQDTASGFFITRDGLLIVAAQGRLIPFDLTPAEKRDFADALAAAADREERDLERSDDRTSLAKAPVAGRA
jgi:hypothetical protein